MARLGPLLSPLLIGRDDLLELAGRRLREAASGRGQFLLISGEAGIGKSRLLNAIVGVARADGFRASDGALAPQDRDVPAALFLDLARTLKRATEFGSLGDDLLALVLGIVDAERPQRRLLVRRVVDLITGAIDRPTMLLFEDVQWADDVSLEILGELARQTRDAPLLLAAAYRSGDSKSSSMLREWRARLVTQRLVEEARLDRLSLDETGLMTTLIMRTGLPAPRSVVAAVYERTDGVPLHVEELLGALGPDSLADSRAIREADVPETLGDATLLRVRRLHPDAQAVARAGAVIGRCFVPEVLAGIMDVPREEVDGPIQELIDNDILDPPGPRGLYDFRHQLLRDALYHSVPAADRRRFHARAAEFGAQLEGASEIHASVHFERAGMREAAFRAALNGARHAARLSSHREAFELYGRAANNMPGDLALGERAEILYRFSDEAGAIEENELCERLAREAGELFEAAGNRLKALETRVNILSVARREGYPLRERLDAAEGLVADLESEPSSRDRDQALAWALDVLAKFYVDALDLGRARVTMQRLQEIAAAIDDSESAAEAAILLGMLDVLEGHVNEGIAAMEASSAQARADGYESVGVTGFRDAALMAVRSMEYAEAASQMQDARRYADAIEQSHCARTMASTDAVLAWAAGDWDEAQRIGEQALADHGRGRAGAIARWSLGYVAAGRGDARGARSHLGAALEFAEHGDWLEMILPARWGLAEAALMAGDPETSLGQCEAAMSAALDRGEHDLLCSFVVTGIRSYLGAGRPEAAKQWLDRISAAIGKRSAVASAAFDHGEGLIRLSTGSINIARDSLEKALQHWDARGRTWEAMWARLDLASAMLRSNRYVDATRLLGEVRTAAERMRSAPLLARIGELERLARGRGSEQEAWYPLSVREFEVARQIAAGRTNVEIATELFVSPKTVSAHVEHILAKLGASRRAEIASWVAGIAQPVA